MASLNVHQSKAGDHDRLGFHPDCPICRQDRLFRVLSPEPILSRRLRVLLATGVLALSAGAAATSVAAEPDDQQEGVMVPEQGVAPPGAPSTDAPEPPPGGETGGGNERPGDELGQGSGGETALPFEVDPVLADPPDDSSGDGSGDARPLETDPTGDPEVGLPLTDPNGPDAFNADDLPAPPAEAAPPVVPALPGEPPLDAGGQSESTEAAPPAGTPERPRQRLRRRGDQRAPAEGDRRDPSANDPGVHERRDSTAIEQSEPSAPSTDGLAIGVAEPAPPVAPPPGVGRFHVVQPGESLWSIAAGLLGRGASAAAIAAEVNRLWERNRERVGTGDPDLLRIGVKLRLR